MKFEDADEIPAGSVMSADICVVGSGAAGITIARELDRTGLQVLVLEAGGLEQDHPAEADAFEIQHLGVPYGNPIATRGRWFGGSTNLWFGRIAMPDPIDFEARPWVPFSGWPIRLADLQPWLAKAAGLLDVGHFDRIAIANWPPNPTINTFIGEGGAGLGVFLWSGAPFMGPHYREAIASSPNVRLLLNGTVTELVPTEDESGIDSVSVVGKSGKRFAVKAGAYVLAAGGLENPRILLASRRRSPAGLGNRNDLVGRFYMDHPRGEGLAGVDLRGLSAGQLQRLTLLGEKSRSDYGKVQLRLTFPAELQRREQLLNHSLHAHLVSDIHNSAGYLAVRRLLTTLKNRGPEQSKTLPRDIVDSVKGAPQLLAFGVRKVLGTPRLSELVVIDQMEQEPDPESRVTLDPARTDAFGVPKLRLDWRIGASTYRSQRRMHTLFRDILAKAGIRAFHSSVLDHPDEAPRLVEMKHPSGTTRMSDAPAEGVVDPDGRVHGLRNLYVTGTSVFPTVGHFNPTLLIVALAARLSAHLREHRRA